ncbi:HTH-type transcriptional regulator BetI [Aquimixticola soesokkakensis]|uniref:HTH-type transcriptional regulator BetI n=1 Tax=Aquimixticola soesokkakensis TaxID=1519096 RepID=A0A1Y5T541_9RHOB|nr:transcriptional regulator BetI [Aquimixticola soesokkakensis]SLN55643.1 HTH-type transcriptional regulator BetI [Aquimixticola soesokkakensis]
MSVKSRKSEDVRRAELIAATIREIGASGTLEVTTSQIAKSAGVSPGLAFHYFNDKEGLFLAAMRSILTDYGRDVRLALKGTRSEDERLRAIVHASFGMTSFRREAISAWVNFYALALRSVPARRLLYIYHRRLHSNLVHALRPKIDGHAPDVARRAAGLIDGLYLRYALDTASAHRTGRALIGKVDGSEGAKDVLRAIAAECAVLRDASELTISTRPPALLAPNPRT